MKDRVKPRIFKTYGETADKNLTARRFQMQGR